MRELEGSTRQAAYQVGGSGRRALGSSSFWMEIHPKSFPHTWGTLPTLFSQGAKC